MKTIEDLGDLRGKRVLVRSDFNVPLDGTTITDDGRVRAALPTLQALLSAGASDVVGDSAKATVAALQDGEIALLENIRFDPRETSKVDEERASLAAELAELADVCVSDGFGVVHRKQA